MALSSDVVKSHEKIKTISAAMGAHHAKEILSMMVQQVFQCCQFLDEARSQMSMQINHLSSTQDELKSNLNNTMADLAELQAVSAQAKTWISTADKT
jgi:outer membrane murein-binding lipoprotein Lpp